MGRQAQTEGFFPRRITPPSVAKATATSPFAAFAENGEDLDTRLTRAAELDPIRPAPCKVCMAFIIALWKNSLRLWKNSTMNLNIKSAETHRLALKLARETGDSITGAVTKAIQAELRRLEDKDKRRAQIDAITAYTSKVLKDGPGSADIDALLYDEFGLPK